MKLINQNHLIKTISVISTTWLQKKWKIQFCPPLKMQDSKLNKITNMIIFMIRKPNNKFLRSTCMKIYNKIRHLLQNKCKSKEKISMHSTVWLRRKWMVHWFLTTMTKISTGLEIKKITNNNQWKKRTNKRLNNKISATSMITSHNTCPNLRSQPIIQKSRLLKKFNHNLR